MRLSATQINMYLGCGAQYAFRYDQGLIVPPGAAMKQSGVAHQAYERNYKQKATSLKDLPLDEMTDYFAETWEQELQREEVIFHRADGETAASIKDQGIAVVRAHHTGIAPVVTPAIENGKPLVEHWIEVPLIKKPDNPGQEPISYDLVAKLDLVDTQNIIRDNKTLARAPSQSEIDRDVQLSIYALARRIETKQPETALAHDVVVKNKTPKAISIPTERSREQLILTLNQIGHVVRGIKARSFPINPKAWFCSPKYCGYASRCIWGTMPKHVDMGANLEQQLTDSLKEPEGNAE